MKILHKRFSGGLTLLEIENRILGAIEDVMKKHFLCRSLVDMFNDVESALDEISEVIDYEVVSNLTIPSAHFKFDINLSISHNSKTIHKIITVEV